MAKKNPETYWERMCRLGQEARELTKDCKEHNCPYLKRFSGSKAAAHEVYLQYYCGYCDITGHARLKEPENIDPHKCTHWQDVVEDKKTKLIFNPF